ncbi:MAG: hypothetical protein ACPGXK_13515 [Phycisphaerae bacterium]
MKNMKNSFRQTNESRRNTSKQARKREHADKLAQAVIGDPRQPEHGYNAARGRSATHRRQATVLVFVVAILGILFVTGIAFLTSMDQQAEIVQNQLEGADQQVAITGIAEFVEQELVNSFMIRPGTPGDTESMTTFRQEPYVDPNDGQPRTISRAILSANSWASLPGVHGTYAQIEPSNTIDGYSYTTDFDLMREKDYSLYSDDRDNVTVFPQSLEERGYPVNEFDQIRRSDPYDGLSVDADGDGVLDSRQYVVDKADLPADKYNRIAAAVNDDGATDGRIYLGLRIVPHGGMVNLNDSHPTLLDAVFGYDDEWAPIVNTNAHPDRHGPYVPSIEEPALRRRGGMLPPAEMVISAIQGNPAADTDLQVAGGGDFSNKLFPQNSPFFDGPETAHDGNHQYWPFDLQGLGLLSFQERMTPSDGNSYDRRHLVTTTSHDDLISRGAHIDLNVVCPGNPNLFQNNREDVFNLMSRVVLESQCDGTSDQGYQGLVFEYLDYPHTIFSARRTDEYPTPSGFGTSPDEPRFDTLFTEDGAVSWCECSEESYAACDNDLRKGRLALSLPWLDTALARAPIGLPNATPERTPEHPISEQQRNNLIQEAFMMLLLNARSNDNDEWGRFVQSSSDCSTIDGNAWQRTPTTSSSPESDWKNLSRQVAALTANMIDFMDADGVPSRIPVRNFEFDTVFAADGSVNTGNLQNLGRPYGGSANPEEFMYGLEEQPFIARIAAALVTDDMGNEDPANSSFAVEIFNPYPDRFDKPLNVNEDPFFFIQIDNQPAILLDSVILGNESLVFYNDPTTAFSNLPGGNRAFADPGATLIFQAGSTIRLIREVQYPNDVNATKIVLDEFVVEGAFNYGGLGNNDQKLVVHEKDGFSRISQPTNFSGPWYVTLPPIQGGAQEVSAVNDLGLGQDAIPDSAMRVPVELFLANSGSFETAFPTTGSMLMLMRFANRAFQDGAVDNEFAFTSRLSDTPMALDNGRMPIFDITRRNHWNPAQGPYASGLQPVQPWQSWRPGETMHLPWGQLLFDYFTALPLENEGPYREVNENNDYRVDVSEQPRVDQEGLRVHGRIDLNAAPWFVLRGLPYVPMNEFADYPDQAREWLKQSLTPPQNQGSLPTFNDGPRSLNDVTLPVADDVAGVLGEARAKAIVAYRELRDVENGPDEGNYGCNNDGSTPSCSESRGWNVATPNYRRGTGFLTIGELANVRSNDAQNEYRMDNGRVNASSLTVRTASPFLNAAGPLICLGDWMSIRSHVFTVYGTVRGEFGDAAAEDEFATIEDKAIRFQETMDRLPLFIGEPQPNLIGERVTVSYKDVLND